MLRRNVFKIAILYFYAFAHDCDHCGDVIFCRLQFDKIANGQLVVINYVLHVGMLQSKLMCGEEIGMQSFPTKTAHPNYATSVYVMPGHRTVNDAMTASADVESIAG